MEESGDSMCGEYSIESACSLRISTNHICDTRLEESALQIKPGSWVIIAEDDAVLRSLFTEALMEKGLNVLPASNGLEALELYRKNADKVWLVVADVIMPVMDGLRAAIEMRKINDNIYFFFMSGYDFRRLGIEGIKVEDIPNSSFFIKPFAFKDVISKIQMLESDKF